MRHGKKNNHLGRTHSHRKAMLSNMACSLIQHKRITTTLAKAKALRGYVEPLITKSKTDSTHSRRTVFSYLQNKDIVSELFRDVAPKVGERAGGYTRIIRTGYRLGDNAEMCLIELVDFNELYSNDSTKKTTRRSRRGSGGAKASSGVAASATSEEVTDVVEDTTVAEAVEVVEDAEVITEAVVEEEVAVAEEVVEAAPAVEESSKADDLAIVEGIGPVIAETLVAAGITTFAQLAATAPEKIAEIIADVKGNHIPDTWPQQAQLAADGKWDELKKLQEELDGGKPSED